MRLALLALLLCSCDGLTVVDARLATPERTVETLLRSYGLGDVTQEEVRARLAARERFAMLDRAAFEACFADLHDDSSEGLAGWVVGALAAGRDELRTEIALDRATVSPREGVRIVMRRDVDGWRIVLRESVPDDVQRGIASLAEQSERRALRTGTSAVQ